MLTRLISAVAFSQRPLMTTSLRLLNTSAPRLGDGDHTRSKAKEKASDDLKTRKEQKWTDTVASDSEAVVKGEKQHTKKQGDLKKDMSDLQRDTVDAIKEKEAKGHLHKQDVGRRDTKEERSGSGSGSTDSKNPKKL